MVCERKSHLFIVDFQEGQHDLEIPRGGGQGEVLEESVNHTRDHARIILCPQHRVRLACTTIAMMHKILKTENNRTVKSIHTMLQILIDINGTFLKLASPIFRQSDKIYHPC
jgi:hypothetical protein